MNSTSLALPVPAASVPGRLSVRCRPGSETSDTACRPTSRFGVARTLAQVQACWRLVHDCYRDRGLIDGNAHALHSNLRAAGEHGHVFFGQTDGVIHSTMTMVIDSADGLPLDAVYGQLLHDLRQRGRRLAEMGLLADRRIHPGREFGQAYGTMRYGFHQALRLNADIVIGVHPRHVNFYTRMMGMEVIGPMSLHPSVKHHPVVPLLLDMTRVHLRPLPRLLRHFMEHPVPAAELQGRFDFNTHAMRGSTLQGYLDHLAHRQAKRHFHPHDLFMPMQQTGSL